MMDLSTYGRNQAGRDAYMTDLGVAITAACELPLVPQVIAFVELAELMDAASCLGRTDRWTAACGWAKANAVRDPKWAVLQASVWLAHANS